MIVERGDGGPMVPGSGWHALSKAKGVDGDSHGHALPDVRACHPKQLDRLNQIPFDGSLWMLLRNTGGIAQSVSTDGGLTWRSLYLQGRTFANKRFFIRRLNSGALLIVRNDSPDGKRSHMTPFVSDNDGATLKGGLLLDQRESSYPDGIQAEDGTLFICRSCATPGPADTCIRLSAQTIDFRPKKSDTMNTDLTRIRDASR